MVRRGASLPTEGRRPVSFRTPDRPGSGRPRSRSFEGGRRSRSALGRLGRSSRGGCSGSALVETHAGHSRGVTTEAVGGVRAQRISDPSSVPRRVPSAAPREPLRAFDGPRRARSPARPAQLCPRPSRTVPPRGAAGPAGPGECGDPSPRAGERGSGPGGARARRGGLGTRRRCRSRAVPHIGRAALVVLRGGRPGGPRRSSASARSVRASPRGIARPSSGGRGGPRRTMGRSGARGSGIGVE